MLGMLTAPAISSAENLEWSCDHGIYDLCGYSDGEGVLLTCPYEDHEEFSEGLAAVKIGGKWGFIDESGELVIPAIYDDVDFAAEKRLIEGYKFRNDMAAVSFNDRSGVIYRNGETVLPFEYNIHSHAYYSMFLVDGQMV